MALTLAQAWMKSTWKFLSSSFSNSSTLSSPTASLTKWMKSASSSSADWYFDPAAVLVLAVVSI